MSKTNKAGGELKALIWHCRFHPTDGFHEIGCPHKDWTKDELQKALETKKRFEEEHFKELARPAQAVSEEEIYGYFFQLFGYMFTKAELADKEMNCTKDDAKVMRKLSKELASKLHRPELDEEKVINMYAEIECGDRYNNLHSVTQLRCRTQAKQWHKALTDAYRSGGLWKEKKNG